MKYTHVVMVALCLLGTANLPAQGDEPHPPTEGNTIVFNFLGLATFEVQTLQNAIKCFALLKKSNRRIKIKRKFSKNDKEARASFDNDVQSQLDKGWIVVRRWERPASSMKMRIYFGRYQPSD